MKYIQGGLYLAGGMALVVGMVLKVLHWEGANELIAFGKIGLVAGFVLQTVTVIVTRRQAKRQEGSENARL